MSDPDPVPLRHRALEQTAMVALHAARLLMESGARAQVIRQCAEMMARGLGAERVAFRVGYASLSITLTHGLNSITRMVDVGRHGVNHRLDQALRRLAVRVARGEMTTAEAQQEINRLVVTVTRHPPWVEAVAVGIACAGFGRLLGVDWPGFAAVTIAAGIGQFLRHALVARRINGYVVAALIALAAATGGALLAQVLGSGTVRLALMASVLLLVPGVPALNAQIDIMEGSPTLGSARAVTVLVTMVFVTIGVWLAQALTGALS